MRQAELAVEGVAEFALRKAPFWAGSFHPRDYRRPDYLKNRPGWHVRITFRESIAGPLAIGAGRHCGLGVFAACEAT
jgi:CRISPR-associated protein Csb2